jgi:glycosyltransferase involved in cell wall biosynthesis
MIRVSIILPTYNVELYIERCVRSLENQDLDPTSYEIIVVDDGATDRSVDKVVALQEEFHNIVLVRQPNAGLSAARNTGIRQAKGAYLLFVDSDDAVEANCLSAMLAIADRNPDADLFGFNYRIHLNSGLVVLPKWPATDGRPMSGTRYFETYVAGDYHAVRFLYVRQFLLEHGLSFLEGISFEDVEFIPRLLFHAERVVFNDLPFYLYYLRPHSISTSNLAIHISSRIAAAENLHRFLKAQGGGATPEAYSMVHEVIAECLLAAVSASHRFPSRLPDVARRIRSYEFFPIDTSRCGRHAREAALLNRSVALYWVYSFLRAQIRLARRKLGTALAIAKGPDTAKRFWGYLSRRAR